MAVQVIYNKQRIKDQYPDHFEIIKIVESIDDKMISRLYNDPSITADKFLASAKKHYPNLKDDDKLYFYTNKFRPAKEIIITDSGDEQESITIKI